MGGLGPGVGGFEILVIGLVALLVVGLMFKASVGPFHTWTPDVYQGAPTPVTAFMAACTKVAAFGAIGLLFGLPALYLLARGWLVVPAAVIERTGVIASIAGDSGLAAPSWAGVLIGPPPGSSRTPAARAP